MAERHQTFDKFKGAIKEGADFAVSILQFVEHFENISAFPLKSCVRVAIQDSFVANLYRIIQHMKPKPTAAEPDDDNKENKNDKSMLAAMFPGLSIPNDKKRMLSSPQKEVKSGEQEERDETVDDMMAALESMAPSKKQCVNSQNFVSSII